MAELLPVQVIEPISLDLLTGSPSRRRKFLDWGCFHFDKNYSDLCKRYKETLLQRNNQLKSQIDYQNIQPWDEYLCTLGEAIHLIRKSYIQEFKKIFFSLLQTLDIPLNLSMEYHKGWSNGMLMLDQIFSKFEQDRRFGTTSLGVQRADILLKYQDKVVSTILSRGQLKILSCLMLITQVTVFEKSMNTCCILLLDDLAHELDQANREKLSFLLKNMKNQLFLTSTDQETSLFSVCSMQSQYHMVDGRVSGIA